MALDPQHIVAIYDALLDKAKTLGVFDHFNGAESDNPPGRGLSYSILLGPLTPVPRSSGLAATSGRLEFTGRVEMPRTAKTPAQTDRDLLSACVTVMAAYSADFELVNVPDNLVRNIDLLGGAGRGLEMQPGWLKQGEVPYRMADITVPLILNDVFPQAV